MSAQLLGIHNGNEFYADHYLYSLLSNDLKDTLEGWKAAETPEAPAPPNALRGLARGFFRRRDRLERERSPEERVRLHAEQCADLLSALGYAVRPTHKLVGGGAVPILAEVLRLDGTPAVWCLPVPSAPDEEGPLLTRPLLEAQASTELDAPLLSGTAEEIATAAFDLDEPPRFVLILGDTEVALLERGKWAEQRLLSFDLVEILSRRELGTLQVMASLLAADSLAPGGAQPLVDTLEEASHKHAHEVSEDLKFAIREAIELLGNEANDYWRSVSKASVHGAFESDAERAQELGRECLRYAYRILFMLYLEARPELGYAPMGSDAYERGYSFERLRDLEQLELETDEARNGHYISDSLAILFRMIYHGCEPAPEQARQSELFATSPQAKPFPESPPDAERNGKGSSIHGTFKLPSLRSHLFDPERTPLLNRVRFPNHVLRRVIELLSLSRGTDTKGKRKSRGRISYATLGVNQLGAVYETLLSYRSFFAQTDLYEVKRAKDKDHDELKVGYFVSASELEDYTEDERVRNPDGTLRMHPKGAFLYRLAGRERQTSASYYTPQSLTQALVKYAFQELLFDADGELTRSADELLELTICEPAMGSAAFLNEAVDQLAELYLQARQKELGERIKHEDYATEKQRVKMLLADNNVFGVDLNPLAIELAEVSLWLNTIHPGGFVPWFGMQLACGNSLIGAWRKVFTADQVDAGERGGATPWLDAVPTRVPLGEPRPAGSIYHFFLPDRDMAVYGQGNEGKPIQELRAPALALLKERCAALRMPLEEEERETLVELSDAVDRLWATHADMMRTVRKGTTDPMRIYGREVVERTPTTTRHKDAVWEQVLESRGVRASSPYRRLKFVMDYWCALWFWPIDEASLFPSREELLLEFELLLSADVLRASVDNEEQRPLFAPTMDRKEAQALLDEHGYVDVSALCEKFPRLALVKRLAERYRFHHWELEFADVFAERGGFDLVLGNPPWIKISWKERDVLGDVDPSFVLKGLSAPAAASRRPAALARAGVEAVYLAAHEQAAGTQGFLTSKQNYPLLAGVQANLYRCFLPVAWDLSTALGCTGFVHPESVYDDPKGGPLRSVLFERLRRHYQFWNERDLFAEVHNQTKFSLNVYGPPLAEPKFSHINNLYEPLTIDACHSHPGGGRVPGIKTEENTWETQGHRDRIIEVDRETLRMFAVLYDEPGTPAREARLPAIHSRQLVRVLERFSEWECRIEEVDSQYKSSKMWHEVGAQTNATIRQETVFPDNGESLVLSGPHFYVGNPLYKTPRAECPNNKHYDVIDLEEIPADYLPRTNYVPDCSGVEYLSRTPKVDWSTDSAAPITGFFRIVVPRRVSPPGERTLQPAIAAPGCAHIDSVNSYAFERRRALLQVAASWSALPCDYYLKSTGSGNFWPNQARGVPVVRHLMPGLAVRTLLLNCLTGAYARLWRDSFEEAYTQERWTRQDRRLEDAHFAELTSEWCWDTPLRTDYSRRQALLELDVLVARNFGLTLDELQTTYRVQFPVLRQNEQDTWYDQRGRIVFTCSMGLVGVGLSRKPKKGDPNPGWEDVRHMTSGTVERTITADTLPGGPRERTIVYHAPFDRCDREEDYATAWAAFDAREADA